MNIQNMEIPSHLHAKIMKRVFVASYGKYLIFSTAILAVNLSVLGTQLYRALTTNTASSALRALRDSFAVDPAYMASALNTITSIIPTQALIATGLAIALSAYVAIKFIRIYRNPTGQNICEVINNQ